MLSTMLSTRSTSEPAADDGSQSDTDLIQAVARQDRRAFETLYRRYYPRLLGFARRWVSANEQAEEVVQEVMFAVWKDAATFQGRSKVSTWIFGITYRQAMKSIERSSKLSLADDERMPERGTEDRALGNRELRLSLDKALAKLSPEHRTVLELTFFEDRNYREIAEILDCPQNTVKTRMFHARERLRRILPRLGWSIT